jgi:hypothetical protein
VAAGVTHASSDCSFDPGLKKRSTDRSLFSLDSAYKSVGVRLGGLQNQRQMLTLARVTDDHEVHEDRDQ